MHKEWCGKPCSECETLCALDESMPCSPNCDKLSEEGQPMNLRECLEHGCDAIICVDKIQEAVAAEKKAYKKRITGLSKNKVYETAYDIHLVEEMTYLVCDCPENYKDDTDVMWFLYSLSKEGKFLDEYLKWSYTLDSVDVSNVEKTYDTLRDFCDYQSEKTA
ncbi:MAG: hypothetical protein FWF86_09095 [Clostridia bacterium]|nr:hypothetical protein [Clostridia bacterium]